MLNFSKNVLLLLTLAVLASCKNDSDNYTAYFRGVVSNPSTRYIVLSKDNKVIDTIPLDEHNHFFKKFDSLTPGLYSFKHEPDYDYIYFEKNDSLNVNIDALNFDRSIVFSGRGQQKNNFMMELYLINEKDKKHFPDIYKNNVDQFTAICDSAYKAKEVFYKKQKKQNNWSNGFDFYAKERLDLNYYTKKERYAYIHNIQTGEDIRPQLPENYYDFRKEINLNDPKLIYFSPFARYITAMLNNMASERNDPALAIENKSLEENIDKLRIADSIFTNKQVKNEVLDNIAFAYILEDENIANNEKFLDEYAKLSDSKDNDIKKMGRSIKILKPGNKIPTIALFDKKDRPFDINTDITKQTVIFFWTACAQLQLNMMQEKVKKLKQEYPDVNFIAVNVDEEAEWKKMMSEYRFRVVKPLHAQNFNELKFKWVLTKINRTIILNADGTIKNAFTNLMDPKFTEYLK